MSKGWARAKVHLHSVYKTILPELISGLKITVSNSVIVMLGKVRPNGEPIETPSVCL